MKRLRNMLLNICWVRVILTLPVVFCTFSSGIYFKWGYFKVAQESSCGSGRRLHCSAGCTRLRCSRTSSLALCILGWLPFWICRRLKHKSLNVILITDCDWENLKSNVVCCNVMLSTVFSCCQYEISSLLQLKIYL